MNSYSIIQTQPAKQAARWTALVVAGLLLASPAFAAKPDGVGNDKGQKHEQVEKRESSHHNHGSTQVNVFLNDRQRSIIRDYYGQEFKRGNCPPGLAKKNNGCLPPGQAKKWQRGHRMSDDVVYYDLPRALLEQLGGAPKGHKYVRVDDDVLLMTIGTALVIDAIEGLGGL